MINIHTIYLNLMKLSENYPDYEISIDNYDSDEEFIEFSMISDSFLDYQFKIDKDSEYYIISQFISDDLYEYLEIFRINSNYISNDDIILEFIKRYLKYTKSIYMNSEKYRDRFEKFRKSLENELNNLKIEYHNEFIQIIFNNELIFQINEFIFEDDYENYIDLSILSIYYYLINIKDRIF